MINKRKFKQLEEEKHFSHITFNTTFLVTKTNTAIIPILFLGSKASSPKLLHALIVKAIKTQSK